jgi:DNA-binding MarR family transcriptional regulator
MRELKEEMLASWVKLSIAVSSERIVSELTYNESLICNILYRQQLEHAGQYLTATDLCRETKMLKSLMNRTLNSMEEKQLILRERSHVDKRQIFIRLNPEQQAVYEAQHEQILQIIEKIIEKTGREKAEEAVALFELMADSVKDIIK